MVPKHRLPKVFFLLLSVVSLSSIILMAVLWINYELGRSQQESLRTREEYFDSLESSISVETNRIVDYLVTQTSASQVKFYINLRNRVLEIHDMLDSLKRESGISFGSEEFKEILLAMLHHLAFNEGRSGYFCLTADGEFLSGSEPPIGPSSTHRYTEKHPNLGPYLEAEDLKKALKSVTIIGEGFYRVPLVPQKLGEEEVFDRNEVPVTFLKRFIDFNWVIGTSEFYSDFESELGGELLAWIDNVPISPEENLLILDYQGQILSFRNPSLIGLNVFEGDLGTGLMDVAVKTIRGAKERTKGFLRFNIKPTGSYDESELGVECLAYFRAVPELKWVVIDFVTLSELDEALKAQREILQKNLSLAITKVLVITAAMLVVIFIITMFLSSKAASNLSAFFDFFEKAATSSIEIDPAAQHFEEFSRLAEAANTMIRERRVADLKLSESELRFRTVFNVSPGGISILDAFGRLLEANLEFESYLNMPLAQATNRPLVEVMSIEPADFKKLIRDVTSKGESSAREIVLIDRDGNPICLLLFARLMSYLEETLILLVCVNITVVRQAEKEKAELMEKLSRSRTMEAMGRMASQAAHELNNILSALIGYPELMIKEGNLTEAQLNHVNEIMDAGHRASAVVSDLLTLSRGVATAKVAVDLNELTASTISGKPITQALKLAKKPLEVKTDFVSPSAVVKGSPVHLRKVISNLIENAIEVLAENGGTVTVVTSKLSLKENPGSLENFSPGSYISLKVIDDGPGIANSEIEKIFEPFYSKKAGTGRGLGLALVDLAVKEHGGAVRVNSSSSGTCFEVLFPALEAVSAKNMGPFGRQRGQGQKVLVVDDVDIQRKLAKKMLLSLGYEPFAVASGEEAVDYLKNNDVDLIILDMIMEPGINGRQTYEKILTFKPWQKAIIASGLAENEEVVRAQALGASNFVSKPYTLDDIAGAVHKALHPEGSGP